MRPMPILLASASPRRYALLTQAGIPCTVCACDVDETVPDCLAPDETVRVLSKRKAMAARDMLRRERSGTDASLILAADTLVSLETEGKPPSVLGKPRDTAEARAMLRSLQGRRHTVYTGVTLLSESKEVSFTERADVWMRALNDAEIAAYADTGEPLDKAGAYGVQGKGAMLIERVEGDYFTVVGLPLARLYTALKEFDMDAMRAWNGGPPSP